MPDSVHAEYSEAFELVQATQVSINASGPYNGARDAYLETFLQRQGGSRLNVSYTEIEGDGDCANGCTLRLGPGRYTWYTRMMVRPGGAVFSGAPLTGNHEKYADATQYGAIGACAVRGTGKGFLLASCVKARDVTVSVTVRATLKAQERVRAELIAIDHEDPARFNMSSFQGEIAGAGVRELKVEATPIFFRLNRVFRFSYAVEHEGGNSPKSIALAAG